ncbi:MULTISPECIES: 3-oxoacyl-[acyl-carrier-protein] reductase [Pelosinus]|uniref:3-oxoacyl-[acyl-carrier-protein] reductase n=1 Tax=Pelosinus fermentans B4 TaxID=1149862 RepID=I8RIW3_9FIRM|nr:MULTISPECIES: 3-oxoacyl-[acyl-carrier-protein] reductase [Pelosinus]EIW18060.1 3-oxoacyl-(acyl-carrier-protein) reductase [Pelosinus fermentans B4]EIW24098.1 3-oxoacyl-(acyl-carrier-protein) reductase [Pelosinus fermentans A11]OAM94207.1 3-oxoacyl-(acyl-carrier-protein) reductase [Pelosinus fermentans DSM 17108]SDR02977.1 3-oxoacyl-[acyl-carrier-protein] reductase [Pelosinus fermentans]
MHLDGKVAIITGASRGIGRSVAIELAKLGAKVVINYAGNEAAAEEVKNIIVAAGGQGIVIKADVGDVEAVDAMVKETISTFGKIDILVNNAGITRDNLLMRMKEEDWDAVMNINLKGVFVCTKAVSRIMMKQRAGKIINMTSVVGLMGNAGQANYAAAKAGVIGFTKSMAKELASRGITVNAIAPGFIGTDMTAVLSDQVKTELTEKIPAGRLGSPEDVAAAVTFLASDSANYITGQTLNVDGGMLM